MNASDGDDGHEARRARASLVGSSVLFGLMAVAVRAASARIPAAEIALVRFATGSLAVAVAVMLGRARLRPARWAWLLARGFFGGTAVLLYFWSIEHIGVGVATLLNYTAPVWAMLLGWWLLDEKPRATAVAALGLTLLGMVCVVSDRLSGLRAGIWELVGVAAAICSGVAMTSVRAARRRSDDGLSESAWTVFASFTSFGVVVTLPAVIAPFGSWISPHPGEWLLLLAVGLLSLVAQLIMTAALEHVTAATSGIVHQLTVVIALVCGIVFFDERLTSWALLGSALTISGVAWTVLSSSSKARP